MALLQIVIGLIFILLLLSLLATTIMELISSIFALRGRNLEKALKNMLASSDDNDIVLTAFKDNSMYRQLSYRFGKRRYAPSYMSPKSFQSILFDVLLGNKDTSVQNLKEKIAEVPDEDLRNVLNQLLRDGEEHVDSFKKEVHKWYNNIMDRASGWYKRSTQKILIGVGLFIAVLFNADTISIYQNLKSNPEKLDQLVTMAEKFVAENEGVSLAEQDRDFDVAYNNLKSMINNEINQLQNFGIGWNEGALIEIDEEGWAIKILGWIVTALAISLGAPFWFDLLNNLVNIRGAGKKSEE